MSMRLLDAMAQEMRRYAAENPWRSGMPITRYRHRIGAGVTAEFYLNALTGEYTLAIARQRSIPLDEECDVTCAAFGAPLDLRSDPLHVSGPWFVRKFYWQESA